MRVSKKALVAGLVFAGMFSAGASAQLQTGPMSFFITSAGSGNGGDLGGLEGADAICEARAEAVGAGDRTWRAYLSTQGSDAVNARDRIGSGPWFNAHGTQIAANVDALHSSNHRLSFINALDEQGRFIPGGGFSPNRHDILTGSQEDGTAYPADTDMTCNNWTSSSNDNKARLGHHDFANWNSNHDSRGCSLDSLVATGGYGLFYCFAAE